MKKQMERVIQIDKRNQTLTYLVYEQRVSNTLMHARGHGHKQIFSLWIAKIFKW